ncbi:AvrD family protein [Streptomyces sp. CA-132043]|uniref:AvrD family protein n=1 Tax=Streptomyces sp. CA-132043 TaxID=3240048 RepID=UPI003D8D8665
MTRPAQLCLRTAAEYLGPLEKRFFSSGYRRAEHTVTDLSLTPPDVEQAGISALVTVAYPADWSKKRDEIDLPPHLSSIDTLVLAAQLAEAHITHAYGLDEAARTRMRLRRVKLTAGTTPQEELTGLPAHARLLETRLLDAASGTSLSVYACRIGQMRAHCEIEHLAGGPVGRASRHARLEDILGPAEGRYYGSGFVHDAQHIDAVRADVERLSATAAVRLSRDEGRSDRRGGDRGRTVPRPDDD